MDTTQKQMIEEQMQKIPAPVREAIERSDWERTVFNIGRQYKLHIDDIDALSIETILTMIGLEHPKDFRANLEKHAGVSGEILDHIVDDINTKLFAKIREALKKHYEKESADEIMSDDEAGELFHAGIELEGASAPTTEKKNIATLVDRRLSKPSVSPAVVSDEPTKAPTAPAAKKPDIGFDPYREPIE